MTILSLVGVFARLGVTDSVMRFVPEFEGDKRTQGRYVTIAFCTSVAGSILAGIFLYITADTISNFTLDNPVFEDILRILAIFLPFQVLTQSISNAFRAYENARYQILIQKIIVPTLNIISISIALFLGATIIGVSAAIALAGVLVTIFSIIIFVDATDVEFNIATNREEIYEYYNFSLPLTLTAAGSLLYTKVDRLMVGYFLGDVEVGIYAISIALATVTGIALSGLNQLFPPVASKLHTEGNREELTQVFQAVTRWSFTVCLLPAILLYTYRFEVLGLFGPEFVAGSLVLSLFVVAQITRSAVGPSGYMLTMSDHQYVVLFNRWFLGFSNVVANYILIQMYGFIGAAIASALTLAVVNLFRLLELWHLERYHPYSYRFLKPIAAGLILFILSAFVHLLLLEYNLPRTIMIILGCAFGGVMYIVTLLLLGFDDVDHDLYDELVK